MTNENQIQLVAYLVAKPSKEDDLVAALLAIVPTVQQEPGCIAYVPHVSREHSGTIVMYEVWEDQAALDAHAQGANFTGLAARFDELLREPLRLELLQRLN
jgi:quinol monooxygenase YgiN